eukprot:scaffold894_cov130-Isochrysis_galbana.AAC.2
MALRCNSTPAAFRPPPHAQVWLAQSASATDRRAGAAPSAATSPPAAAEPDAPLARHGERAQAIPRRGRSLLREADGQRAAQWPDLPHLKQVPLEVPMSRLRPWPPVHFTMVTSMPGLRLAKP